MTNSDTFAIYIHHGGRFMNLGSDRIYEGGQIERKHDLDANRFGFLDLEDEVKNLGYISWKILVYKVPKTVVYKGLTGDRDVLDMLSHLSQRCKIISIFVDDGKKVELDGVEDSGNPIVDAEVTNLSANEKREQVREVAGEIDIEIQMQGKFNEGFDDNSSEDFEYNPSSDSDTDDDLSANELASEDEEYIEARHELKHNNRKDNFFSDCVSVDEHRIPHHMQIVDGSADRKGHCENDQLGFISEYEDSDGEMNSDSTDDEADNLRRKKKKVTYDPKCDHKTLKLSIGMRFIDGYQCKEVIRRISIIHGYPLRFTRCNKNQCEAICIPQCGWRCYGSVVKIDGSFQIKVIVGEHKCPRVMSNKQCTSGWIAKQYLNTFRVRPDMSKKELESDIMRTYACQVSKWRLYAAIEKMRDMLKGSLEDHYALLRRYIAELMKVDKDGRFELLLGDENVFKAFYVGFSSLKKGFMRGCRSVIGFDGCFLKTHMGGITDGLGYTFISDQQKGLTNAVSELTPFAEHRNCARHVYCNWKKQYKGATLKNLFWRAVRSTYVESYKLALEDMKTENENAYLNFLERDPKKFCKAFISTFNTCDMVDNNISETFNGYIVNAREKPLIQMLEDIRNALMTRMYKKFAHANRVSDKICPSVRVKLEKNKLESRYCIAYPALDDKFEVHSHEDQFVVNFRSKSCTCRVWDLTGIPCVHTCSAITFMNLDHTDYVADCYSIEKYMQAYQCGLEPSNGSNMWPDAPGDPVQPPKARKMPGRPPKKRKRDVDEKNPQNPNKLKRTGLIRMICQRCQQPGHNTRTCRNESVEKPPIEKRRRGRPCKHTEDDGASKRTARKMRMHNLTSNSVAQRKNAVIARERTLVQKGYGVMTSEETGNIYARMPSEKRAYFVNPTAWKSNNQSRNTSILTRVEAGQKVIETSSSKGKTNEFPTQESRS
ncbi:hypothetical protein C2S52_012741 [Perilla frutescens var. hirtella]|nr:hypothetical protein C2S52_012741 [Perilla frutescens var. hirtella]